MAASKASHLAANEPPQSIPTRSGMYPSDCQGRWPEAPSPMTVRCAWVGDDPLDIAYHDTEWGVPVHDDRVLFEFLVLEGAQAGLSWQTVLRKRENYRAALDGFDPALIARYDEAKLVELAQNPGIIRNKLKIASLVRNARGFLDIVDQHGSFASWIWQFVDGQPVQNRWQTMADVPVSNAASKAMSKALKKRNFNFVGETICYAYMQAVGMVNDHTVDCFRHAECA